MSDIYTLIMGLLAHSWFEIMEFSQILVIPAFWHWKIAAQRKWSNFSKKRQYFWFICVEWNLTFCREEIWSFFKVLHYHILEELINVRLKCSYLSLAQVTPFYATWQSSEQEFSIPCKSYKSPNCHVKTSLIKTHPPNIDLTFGVAVWVWTP